MRVVPLGDAADVLSGFAFKSEWFQDEGTKVIRIGDIDNEEVSSENCVSVDASKHRISESCVAKEFDILMALSGATTGKIGIVDKHLDGALVNQRIGIVRASNIDTQKYLRYIFSGEFLNRLLNQSWGAAQANLSPRALRELKIPLPPLDEQRRIAAILDKADAVRRKRKDAIALTEDLLRSAFLEMFGDPVAKGWEMVNVESLIKGQKGAIRTGPFGSQLLHSEFVDQGIAVLGIDNAVKNQFRWAEPRFITSEKYQQLKRYTVRPGDVLITIMGTCGRCAIVPDNCPEAINTKHLCCITLDPEKCLPEFLHSYFLTHPVAQQYLARSAKGAIMAGLNMAIIKGLPVPLVPLQIQQQFRAIKQKNISLGEQSFKAKTEDDNLFNSLLQRAFQGDL